MNSSRKILLAVGLCVCLAALSRKLRTQPNNAPPPRTLPASGHRPLQSSKPKPPVQLKSHASQAQRHPAPTPTRDLIAHYKATASHKQVLQVCWRLNQINEAVTQDITGQKYFTKKENLRTRGELAAVWKRLIATQKLLEKQLKGNLVPQRVLIQNDLADVHFALGIAHRFTTPPSRLFYYTEQDIYHRHKQEIISHRQQAVDQYKIALSTDKLNRPFHAGLDIFYIAGTCFDKGEFSKPDSRGYKEASYYWQQAAKTFHKINNKIYEADAMHHAASAYRYGEDYENTIKTLHNALVLYQSLGDRDRVAGELNSLGEMYSLLAYDKKASLYYSKALVIYRELKNRGEEARVLRNLASISVGSREYQVALHRLHAARSIYDELAPPGPQASNAPDARREMWSLFGEVYMEMGKYKEARRCYEQGLLYVRQTCDDPYHSPQGAFGLADIGHLYLKQQRYKEALPYYKRALPTIEKLNKRRAIAYILTDITDVYAHLKQPQQAILSGKRAINLVQSLRADSQNLDPGAQRAFLAAHRGLYEQVASLLVEQNRQAEAEQVLRFLRQEDAFDSLKRNPALIREMAPLFKPLIFTRDEERMLSREVVANEHVSVGQGNQESYSWQRELGQQEKAGWGRAALISTFNTADKLYILLTTSKERRAFSVPVKKNDFDALSKRLQYVLSNPYFDPIPDAQKMYRLVFAKGQLEQALQRAGITTALWFPSGSLRAIPISTLHDGKQYLVRKPRLNVYVTLKSSRLFGGTTHGSALAVGVSQEHTIKDNASGDKSVEFPPLSNVPQEVRSIIKNLKGGKILLDKQFTLTNLEHYIAQGVSTFHIATHFELSGQGDEEPYFLMGDGSKLPLSQWKQSLHLQDVSLLTLSACNTGIGTPDANGGDVSSIGEVSQWLGAQTVVVSLWPVNDASTPILMRKFYERLHNSPGLGKAQALRGAQLDLLDRTGDTRPTRTQPKRGIFPGGSWDDNALTHPQYQPFIESPTHPYSHPFYWAPFSLIGNWK